MQSYLNFHRLQKEERLPIFFFFSLVKITVMPYLQKKVKDTTQNYTMADQNPDFSNRSLRNPESLTEALSHNGRPKSGFLQ